MYIYYSVVYIIITTTMIIIKVFVKRKILSIETILSGYISNNNNINNNEIFTKGGPLI